MKSVRLLLIGDLKLASISAITLKRFDVRVEITGLKRSEFYDAYLREFVISRRGLDLVQNATPELYDAIIICDNHGTGVKYARKVSRPMRCRTMIIWDVYRRGCESQYPEQLRFFGSRVRRNGERDAEWFLSELAH